MIALASLAFSVSMLQASCDSCCSACSSEKDATSTLQPMAADQAKLTPAGVLEDLMAGNQRFIAETPLQIPTAKRVAAGTTGQFPKAYILSCVDSRVPVEEVFDQSIGDIFVGRVAGNVESIDQLGSMEFASAAAGVKLIMVLGHEACGAVKGACDGVKLGNLTELLAQINPAVEEAKEKVERDYSSKNTEFVNAAIEANVEQTLDDIRERSEVIAGLEKDGKLMLVGGIYSLHTGEVTLLSR